MLERARLFTRLDLEDIIGDEISTPMRMGKTAARLIEAPRRRLQRQKIVTEIEMDRNILALGPDHIGIEKEFAALGRRSGHVFPLHRRTGFGPVFFIVNPR